MTLFLIWLLTTALLSVGTLTALDVNRTRRRPLRPTM